MLIALLLRLAFQPVKTCGFLKMVGNKLNGFYLPHFIRTNFSKAPPPPCQSDVSAPSTPCLGCQGIGEAAKRLQQGGDGATGDVLHEDAERGWG